MKTIARVLMSYIKTNTANSYHPKRYPLFTLPDLSVLAEGRESNILVSISQRASRRSALIECVETSTKILKWLRNPITTNLATDVLQNKQCIKYRKHNQHLKAILAVTNTSDLCYRHNSRALALRRTVGSGYSKAVDLSTVNTDLVCSKNDNDPW